MFLGQLQVPNFYLANLKTDPFPGILTSMQGLDAASNQKVALFQKLMFLGHLQVLVNTAPPNSQLLFSEPGNGPVFGHLMSPQRLGAALNKKKLL